MTRRRQKRWMGRRTLALQLIHKARVALQSGDLDQASQLVLRAERAMDQLTA